MDFAIFFNALDQNAFEDIHDTSSLYAFIEGYYLQSFPNWQDADIALIGIIEDRGTHTNPGVAEAPEALRRQFYRLKKSDKPYKIVDLGNLRPGATLTETYLRLKAICEALLSHNTVPVIFGGSNDVMLGQYWGYESLEKIISVANIDAFVDVDESSQEPSRSHLLQLLTYQPNYLFNFSQIGHQAYLNSQKFMEIFERLYFNVYSVGRIREDIHEIEPIIREAEMIAFDVSAIRMQDAPASAWAQPFGLNSDEACQICWFAGLNEKTTSIGFYEFNPLLDEREMTAKTLAIMIWYFIEGFYHRRHESDFQSGAFMKYYVEIPSSEQDIHRLVFYKQLSTEKWWMEVPSQQEEQPMPHIVPCSYKDYQTALSGELPYRWINTYAKLV